MDVAKCVPIAIHVQCVMNCVLAVQIGWVTGPEYLVNAIAKAHQFMIFTVASNLQRAVAYGLDYESSFFTYAFTFFCCLKRASIHTLVDIRA